MDNVIQFFLNFGQYCKDASGALGYCIFVPLATLTAIWLLTLVGLKLFVKKEKLKSVFLIHRTIIASSLIVATALIAIICYCQSKNLFAYTHAELAFIISLIIAFVVPIVSLFVLRGYYEKERMNEIAGQPVSAIQAADNISVIRKAFNQNKHWYLLPLIGFLFLLFSLNSGKNLISIVFDNSVSMDLKEATNALTETFDKLSENNEIIFTNLNNKDTEYTGDKKMTDVFAIKQSNKIKVGACYAYNTPKEANRSFQSTILEAAKSPICEVVWKMWLFTKETKANYEYKHKLLIVITDGEENWVKNIDKFFYDDTEFAEYYTPENTYIIDYSQSGDGILIKKFGDTGANIYSAVTSVDNYLEALNAALASFQNNIYLIIWVIAIYVIFAIFGLCITPKNISL